MNIPKHIPVWSQLDFLEKFLSGAEYLWNFLFCAVWLYSIHNFSKNLSQSAYQKIDLHTCTHPTTKPMSAVFLLSPKFPENLILVHLLFHPTCSKMCLPPCAVTTMSSELLMKVQSTICKSLSVPLAVSDVTKWHPSVVTGHSSIHDCCCLLSLLVLLFWRIFQVCSVSVGHAISETIVFSVCSSSLGILKSKKFTWWLQNLAFLLLLLETELFVSEIKHACFAPMSFTGVSL